MANTKLEELNLLDKFLFDEAMEDAEVYRAAVSILLENEVELLGKSETEKEFRVSPELHEVRLDVVGMDREGTVYYTEMQQRNTESRKIRRIHRKVCQIRKSEKAGVKYMQRWEEIAYAKAEGRSLKLVSQICKKVEKSKTLEKIAEELEEEVSAIEPIYNKVKEAIPPYDPELILEQLNAYPY